MNANHLVETCISRHSEGN